jgi:WD40 repeat protein
MPNLCHSCSAPLSSGSAAGVCPACLLMGAQVLAEEGSEPVLRRVGGYDLLERIGRGGMGVVYKARQTALGRTVAVKMVSAGELAAPEILRRFKLEAEAAARLQHPGIVGIHEVGEHDGLPYYSMEFVPGGRTLASLIAEKPMPAHAAAACLEKVARAVHHAHEHGVLHRDLKPSNILLDEQGEPRVADFGLARQLGADSSLTISRNALGSPAYMPPEQAGGRSAEAGPASDVYSLGAVLYHCLTGRPPFAGESVQTVLLQVREADPVPPRRLNASIPRDLDTIVLKCLEKSPSRRYVSAAALADELSRWLRGEPVLARPVGATGKFWRWTRRHPGVAALLAVLALALAGGAALMIHSNNLLAGGKRDVESALADALISRAESAARGTGQPGQRTAALDAIRQATALALTPDEKFRARNAALTALALPEATFLPQPHLPPPGDWTMCLCDPGLRSYVRADFDGKVTVHRVDGSAPVRTFDLAPRKIDCLLCMDRSGKLLAYRYDKTRLGILHIEIGSMPFAAEPWKIPGDFRPCQVSFGKWTFTLRRVGLPVGKEITIVAWPEPDGSIAIADPLMGLKLLSWPPPEDAARCQALQFSHDGKWIAAARGTPPRLDVLQMPRGKLHNTRLLPAAVHALRWVSWHGRLGLGYDNGRVAVEDSFPDTRYPAARMGGYEAHAREVVSLDFGGGGILSTSEDGTTNLWNRRSSSADFTFAAASWRTEFDKSSLTAGPAIRGGVVGFLKFEPGKVIEIGGNTMLGEASGTHCVMPNGRGIALLHPEGIEFQNTVKYSMRNRVALQSPLSAVASPRSDWLLAGQADRISLLSIRWPERGGIITATPEAVLPGLKQVNAMSLSRDGRLLAFSEQGRHQVSVHSVSPDGKEIGPASGVVPLTNAMACALSSDGKKLAAGSAVPAQVIVQNVSANSAPLALTTAADAHNWHPVFSSDGRWLALSGRSCQLFHAATLEPGPVLDIPDNGADHHGAAFYCPPKQPDRCLVAVVAADREIHLFRILHGPPALVEKLAIFLLPDQSFVSLPAFDELGNLTVALPRAQLATWQLGSCFQELRELKLEWSAAK